MRKPGIEGRGLGGRAGAPAPNPLFSVGVTTYGRLASLRETLQGVLRQTFDSFEVIVGNDLVGETLTPDMVGATDPRLRIVNHPENLGELGNMARLLALARGAYFTWLADDDLYAPGFLEAVAHALDRRVRPRCVFTGYQVFGAGRAPESAGLGRAEARLLSGRAFARKAFGGELRAIGTCGVYETKTLRQWGGVRRMTDGPFALYSEYLLLAQAGLLAQVAYVPAPLVLYRKHEGSWGCSNDELDLYVQAGQRLVRDCAHVFCSPELRPDFRRNLCGAIRLTFDNLVEPLYPARGLRSLGPLLGYARSLLGGLATLPTAALRHAARACLLQETAHMFCEVAYRRETHAGYQAHHAGCLREARRRFLAAACRNPFILLRRDVASILMESVAGPRRMHRLRSWMRASR